MAFIIEAALGVGISELVKGARAAAKQTQNFKSNLETLENTLESVKPIFHEIGELNRVLNRPEEETYQFIDQLNRGVNLVYKCSAIPYWNAYKLYKYSRKLEKLDKCIVKFFNIQVQGSVAVNSLRNGVVIREINDKFDFILKYFNIEYEHTSAGVYNASTSGFSVSGPKSVPGLPDVVFGFNKPLQDLKKMLLHDKEPVTVISAPGGFGKTTLAKLLCRDSEIQSIFGGNIFFVTIPISANINVIVKKICKLHLPHSQLPDFRIDDDAINHLKFFLKCLGPRPILLVLDDVWPDLEPLIGNLTFTLPNYKILVTSRFSFPRFGPVYNLKSLDDKDAMSLFCHSALPKDGSSNIPYDLVEKAVKVCNGFPLALKVVGRSLSGCPEVVWRREQKKWSDGKSILDTCRVLLDRLPTSLYAPEQMKDSSLKDCCMDLRSCPEDQRIPATTLMDMWAERYNLDHKDMDTHSNLGELSFRDLLDLVCTRIPTTINIHLHHVDFWPIAEIQGKSKTTNVDKGTKADIKKSKTIKRNRPKLQLIRNGAFQLRVGLPGVVNREPSSQVISSQASQCEDTSKKGGKGKEKVVYKAKKKVLKPEGDHYYLDKDGYERLLQELGGPLFNNAVIMPTPSHVQRPPTNGSSSASNQWNSQIRKGLPGVVIREPSSQVIPFQASQCEAISTKIGKGKEKVVYNPKKKALEPEGDNYFLDKDESERLPQELRGLLFNSAVFIPTLDHVQRPPTNGTSSASNQWNSHCTTPPTPQPMQPAEPEQPTLSKQVERSARFLEKKHFKFKNTEEIAVDLSS